MDNIILKIDNLSKQYRLGVVGTGTIGDDLKRWWYTFRGKENPFLKIGDENDRSFKGSSDYVWALKDINFEVKEGEVLGIIGKNGAGKSTLLKILSKITSPTTGMVKSKGTIASLLEVGTGFHKELTGKENIYLNGAILGMTKKEISQKIDDIVGFSGCERYIDTPVKRYSSGMTVRLAFAVAAFLEPDILVIDEVLAVGDAEFQKKAIGKMQDISREGGRTVLFVSHDMVAIQSLCEKTMLLENGSISMIDDTYKVINHYLKANNENLVEKLIVQKPKVITEVFINKYNHSKLVSGCKFGIAVSFNTVGLEYITLGYVIHDDMGRNIHAANMQQYYKKFKVQNGKSKLEVSIDSLPLIPGAYSVSIFLGNGSFDIDIIKNAISFSLFWDETKKEIKPKRAWGVVYAPTKWEYV